MKMQKSMPWLKVALLLYAQCVLCYPVGQENLRKSCEVFTFRRSILVDRNGLVDKPAVVFSSEHVDVQLLWKDSGGSVCEGQMKLESGLTLSARVWYAQVPVAVAVETSNPPQNGTVTYLCQHSFVNCLHLVNAVSLLPGLAHEKRSLPQDQVVMNPDHGIVTTFSTVGWAIIALLAFAVAGALCTKSTASYSPKGSVSRSIDTADGKEKKQVNEENIQEAIKITPTKADNSPDISPVVNFQASPLPQGISPQQAIPAGPEHPVSQMHDGSGQPSSKSDPLHCGTGIVVDTDLDTASASIVDHSTTDAAPTDNDTSISQHPVSQLNDKPDVKMQKGSTLGDKIMNFGDVVIEEGYPYSSIHSGSKRTDSKMEGASIPVTTEHEEGPLSGQSAGTESRDEVKQTHSHSRNIVPISQVDTDDVSPYASVRGITGADSRQRSASELNLPKSVQTGPNLDASASLSSQRNRSGSTPEPLNLSIMAHVPMPLPAIPINHNSDEVYDVIPEDLDEENTTNDSHMDGKSSSTTWSERGIDIEDMYESVPENLKTGLGATPPASPKASADSLSPKKTAEKRRMTFTSFFKKKSEIDPHSSSVSPSSPHHQPLHPGHPLHLAPMETNSEVRPISPKKQLDKTTSLPFSLKGAGKLVFSDRLHLPLPELPHAPLPELPEDSGSGNTATVPTKPRILDADDPSYDLVSRDDKLQETGEEEPAYDTVDRTMDNRSDENTNAEEEPGYDSIKRQNMLQLQQLDEEPSVEEDAGYDSVRKELFDQDASRVPLDEIPDEPGYDRVGKELLASIMAANHLEGLGQPSGGNIEDGYAKDQTPAGGAGDGDQPASSGAIAGQSESPAAEVLTFGYAKVTSNPEQLDNAGYASVSMEVKKALQHGNAVSEEDKLSGSKAVIDHDDKGYAVVPAELKLAKKRASQKKPSAEKVSCEEVSAPVHSVLPSAVVAVKPQTSGAEQIENPAPDASLAAAQVLPDPSGHVQTSQLYSVVDVKMKNALRKSDARAGSPTSEEISRLSGHHFAVLPSSEASVSSEPLIPSLSPSDIAEEFPELQSPPIPPQSEGALEVLPIPPELASQPLATEEPAYASVGKGRSSVLVKMADAGYATVGTTATPSSQGAGYAAVGQFKDSPVAAAEDGYDAIGNVQRSLTTSASATRERRLRDETPGYEVVGMQGTNGSNVL